MFLQKYKATFLTHLVVLLFDAVSKDSCFSKFRLLHVKELCTLFVQLFPSFCSGYLTNQCLTFFQGILCSLRESSAYVKGLGFGIRDHLLQRILRHIAPLSVHLHQGMPKLLFKTHLTGPPYTQKNSILKYGCLCPWEFCTPLKEVMHSPQRIQY